MDIKLKPCPWCGRTEDLLLESDSSANHCYWIYCDYCGAQGPATELGADYESTPIAVWNTRVEV